MKIYAIFIEWYNDLGSYISTWKFGQNEQEIYDQIRYIRMTISDAKITKHVFEATEIEETY